MQTQNSTDIQTWTKFFRSAHIPQQYATVYANKFIENRIRFDMLGDLSRDLLHELGINAIGDCLSILKHAKTINSALEEVAKKELTSSNSSINHTYDDSPQSNALKKRCELAKRIIGNYTTTESASETSITTTTKPTLAADGIKQSTTPSTTVANLSASTLSAVLQSRLNFGSGSSSSNGHHHHDHHKQQQQPVVKFNEGSLSSTKVIVSSTTIDEDEPDLLRVDANSTKRSANLKRKLIGHDDDDDDQHEHIESLKKRVSTPSIATYNSSAKIASSVKARLSLNSNPISKTPESKMISLKKSSLTPQPATKEVNKIPTDTLYSSRIENDKSSVFDRIKTKPESSTIVTRPGLVGEANKAAIVRSLGSNTSTSRVVNDVAKRVTRDVPVKVTLSGRLGIAKPSLKDRLSFTK